MMLPIVTVQLAKSLEPKKPAACLSRVGVSEW